MTAAGAAGLVGVWLDVHAGDSCPEDVLVARSLAEVPARLGLVPVRQ